MHGDARCITFPGVLLMKRNRITVSLESGDYQALDVFAHSQDRSLSWVVGQAVKLLVHSAPPKEGSPASPGNTEGDNGDTLGSLAEGLRAAIAKSGLPQVTVAELATATALLLRRRMEGKAPEREKLVCVDLFSGAGGLSIGLDQAGFNSCLAVEVAEDCCETYAARFSKAHLDPKPIQDVKFAAYDGVDLVAGGPPCQPFSSGGKRLAAADHRDMVPQFIRAVKEARPRAFLMENVPGLFAETHTEYLHAAVAQFEAMGYRVTAKILNAADYGVPQKRRRGFLVGLKSGRFSFPPATHGTGADRPHVPSGQVVSAREVFGVPNPSKVFYAKRPDLRPSPYDGHIFNGGGRPIDLSAPCHTILASAGGNKTHFVDPLGEAPRYHSHLMRGGKPRRGQLEGARRLTVEESALLQTFPPGMQFSGSRSSQYTQIGNAVPPLLAEVLGRALIEALS
jgi:DNA (cytosine-5)-methyltransferase 1